ncbi:hypothetical protein [Acinetobacter radioresistens]|uniref:hypothetical protein n=1 Tax=Acinetobacter radioresistens TaxID=40216 RepID=UPI000E7629E4|nr:hypothetical protein [Acinetobacter radioresistens]RJL71668.1 hypothetical protein D5055_08465 [Acinetobacter radioresistens]
MTDKEIILKLGGPAKVAELIKSKNRQRIQNWMYRGIPAKVKLEYPHLFLNTNIKNSTNAA